MIKILWIYSGLHITIVIYINLDEVKPKQLTTSIEDIESFFLRLNIKEINTLENKILINANAYFEKGNFSAFNKTFSIYVKNLKNLTDSEINKLVIRYVISSVIKKNWDSFASDIYAIRQTYTQNDMNIYL